MNKKTLKSEYLSFSLFYNRLQWHNIILEAVKPFLEKEKNIIENYEVSLNQIGGDHIKLFLKPEIDRKLALAQSSKDFFSNYLDNKPSNTIEKLNEEQTIFANFKNNSIHYGVYDFYLFDEMPISLNKNLSDTLISIFSTYGGDTTDSFIEIMFQAYTLFIIEVSLDIEGSIKLFKMLLKEESNNYNPNVLKKIRRINKNDFENNKSELVEYFQSQSSTDVKQFEEEWEGIWTSTIDSYMSNITKPKKDNETEQAYSFILKSLINMFSSNHCLSSYDLFLNTLKSIRK